MRGREARNWVRPLAWIFAGAFAVRLLFLLLLPRLGIDPLGNPDAAQYDMLGSALAAGRGFAPDARNATEALFRPPLYPAFLAGVYGVAGRSIHAVLILQALFGAGAAVIAASIARPRFGGRAAWIAGGILAIHPLMILPGGELLTESLFILLYLGGFLAVSRALDSRGREGIGHSAAAGLLFGLAALARPTPLAAIPILAAGLAWAARPAFGRAGLARAGALMAAAFVAIAPWILTTHARHHAWVPIATTGEFTLYLGNAPGWAERVFIEGESPAGQEWDLDRYREIPQTPPGGFAQKARRIIREDPGRFARLTAIRAGRFLKLVPESRGSAPRRAVAYLGYTIFFPLGVVGWLLAARRRDRLALLLIPVFAAMILIHAVSIPSIRYRVALIDALLPVFAGMILSEIWVRARGRSAAGSAPLQPRS